MGETPKRDFENYEVVGSVTAPFTPLLEDGEINLKVLDEYVKYLTEHHFQYAFVNGTLAEGMSMTMEERKCTAEAWMNAAKGKLKIILHVGCNNLKDSQELARHAEKIGAEAVACLCPSFFKPETEEVLVDYISAIAKEAPNTPFYYYCINFVTGVYLNAARFLRLAKDRIPNLVGLKHSSRELPSAFNCTLVDKKFKVLMGTDNQFLAYLSLGIEVPVTAPYMGTLFHKIKTAFDSGNLEEAKRLQVRIQEVNNIRGKYGGGIEVAKAIFSIMSGIDVGPLRLPLKTLSAEKTAALKKDLEEFGAFE